MLAKGHSGTWCNRPGLTLVRFLIYMLIALILGTLGYCGIKAATAPAGVVTGITVGGPQNLRRGQTGSYIVQVQTQAPLSATAATPVTVQIWEDDTTGDVLLIRTVTVNIPRNATVGTRQFSLTCDAATGDLVGADGRAPVYGNFHVYGYVERQSAVDEYSGDNHEIVCRGDEE